METDLISIIELAGNNRIQKSTIFKILKRLKIEPLKQRSDTNRGQHVSYITVEQAAILLAEIGDRANKPGVAMESDTRNLIDNEVGYFYLALLEPVLDPGRFKVGFAANIRERIRHLRCSAPHIKLLRQWACKRLWEKTAIDAVTQHCDRLNTEVFRAEKIETIAKRCDAFFALMPNIRERDVDQNEIVDSSTR